MDFKHVKKTCSPVHAKQNLPIKTREMVFVQQIGSDQSLTVCHDDKGVDKQKLFTLCVVENINWYNRVGRAV